MGVGGKMVVFILMGIVLLSSVIFGYTDLLLEELDSDEVPSENLEFLKNIFDYAIPIALLISYTIVALGFMVSKVFNSREVENWSKIELREVLISTLYAAIILSFFPFFNAVLDEFSLKTNKITVEEMFIQLIDTTFQPLKSTIDYLFMFSTLNWIGWNPSANAGIPPIPSSPPIVDTPYSHFYNNVSVINVFNLFAQNLFPILFSAITSIIGQIVILHFFEKVLFVFIGLGLVLRSFTFTRKMGGSLLAIVLGLFFLFKLLLVIESNIYISMGLNNEIELINSSSLNFFNLLSENISYLMEGMLKFFEVINLPMYFYQFISDCIKELKAFGFLCFIFVFIMWIIDLFIAVIKISIGLIALSFGIISIMLMGVVTISDTMDLIIVSSIALYSDVLVFGFFMPLLNIIIIMAGIKSLAETFGGDVSVINMLTFI